MIKRAIIIGFLVFLFSLLPLKIFGADYELIYTTDQGASSMQFGKDGYSTYHSQEFSPWSATSTYVCKIISQLKKAGSPTDDVYFELWEGGATPLSGQLVAKTFGINGADITTSPVYYDFYWDTDLYEECQILSEDTIYWLTLRRSGSNDATNYYWAYYINYSIYGWTNWWKVQGEEATRELHMLLYNDLDYEPMYPLPEPGKEIRYELWYVYNLKPRGYYDVPQSHIFDQRFSIQWIPETALVWAWIDKARITLNSLDDYELEQEQKELVFDEIFHSQDGFLGEGSRDYEFEVDFSGDAITPGTYLMSLDFYYSSLLNWDGEWSDRKVIGYYRFPDTGTGEYEDFPEELPDLPTDYFADEPTWFVNKFTEVKYHFPFGYYFLIKDIFDDIDVDSGAEFPAVVQASFPIGGENVEVPIFSLDVINDEYPDFFSTMKSVLTVFFWSLFALYIYERIIHKDALIGFNR